MNERNTDSLVTILGFMAGIAGAILPPLGIAFVFAFFNIDTPSARPSAWFILKMSLIGSVVWLPWFIYSTGLNSFLPWLP